MKQVVLTDIRDMETIDAPIPAIKKPTDVLLKIDTVGVCGSDIHYYTTGRIGSQVVEYPYPVGHECSAVVVEIGSAVTTLKPGDRVAVDPAVSCGDCDQCNVGRRHTCRNLVFMGCPGQIDGCLGEYYVMPAETCFKISDEMTMEQAALIEPLTIGVYAVRQSIPMQGAKVGILGAGPIGLCVMAVCKHLGADAIFVTEPLEYRRKIAEANGADLAINPYADEGLSPITDAEPLLLDVVFECSGEQSALDDGIDLLKPGGKFMLIGIPEVDRVSFNPDFLRRKEICLQNVRRQNECVGITIDMMENQGLNVDFLITHRFDLSQTKTAFDLVAAYDDGVVKAMVTID